MTSDMGEMFNALKKERQIKRASNRATSADLLLERGVSFTSNNNGAHLVVSQDQKTIDFWPGTGRWIDRVGVRGFGVFNMLKHIGLHR